MMAGHAHALPCGSGPHWAISIGADSWGVGACACITARREARSSCRSCRTDGSMEMALGLQHTKSSPTMIQTCVADGMAFLSLAAQPTGYALLHRRKDTAPLQTARAPQTTVRALVFSARFVTVKGEGLNT